MKVLNALSVQHDSLNRNQDTYERTIATLARSLEQTVTDTLVIFKEVSDHQDGCKPNDCDLEKRALLELGVHKQGVHAME